jgi:nascent polypeptide-associated complex subunit alpha
VNDEDVKIVADQAGVSEDAAREALMTSGGDLADAILKLKGQ